MSDITKPNSIKIFFKENTEQRLGKESIPVVLMNLNKISLQVAKKAEKLCKDDGRSTILERDISEAFKGIGGGVDNTPESLFSAIVKMEPEDIGKISLLISEWVKENRRKLNKG